MAEISKTADQALTVLEEVAEHGPLTPAEIARSLGLNRTVVHRLLSTLHQRGFVVRQDNGYRAGAVLVRLADRVEPELRVYGKAVIRHLSDETHETAVLHIADGDEAVVLEQVVAPHVVRVQHQIGSHHKLAVGASGRALLAYLDPRAVDRVLRGVDNSETLRRQLDGVRQLGYALSHDELQQGVHGLAVPVLDQDGVALASLAIIVPSARASNISSHLDNLQAAAGELSGTLVGSAAALAS